MEMRGWRGLRCGVKAGKDEGGWGPKEPEEGLEFPNTLPTPPLLRGPPQAPRYRPPPGFPGLPLAPSGTFAAEEELQVRL